MFDIKEENTVEALRECFSLCERHFYEVGGSSQFDPDWATLESMLSMGMLSVVVARIGNTPVGYYMSMVSRDLLSPEVVGRELAIYVDKQYRGGRLFFKLMGVVQQVLLGRGVRKQYTTFIAGHNDKLPLRLGFSPVEITYSKLIGG